MGWGQQRPSGQPQAPLSVSASITQRSIERTTGKALAEAVRAWLRQDTPRTREAMRQALKEYDHARG